MKGSVEIGAGQFAGIGRHRYDVAIRELQKFTEADQLSVGSDFGETPQSERGIAGQVVAGFVIQGFTDCLGVHRSISTRGNRLAV